MDSVLFLFLNFFFLTARSYYSEGLGLGLGLALSHANHPQELRAQPDARKQLDPWPAVNSFRLPLEVQLTLFGAADCTGTSLTVLGSVRRADDLLRRAGVFR